MNLNFHGTVSFKCYVLSRLSLLPETAGCGSTLLTRLRDDLLKNINNNNNNNNNK